MITIGNKELQTLPPLGETIECWVCGGEHPVTYGTDKNGQESKTLGFMRCGDETYLCGVAGKEYKPRKAPRACRFGIDVAPDGTVGIGEIMDRSNDSESPKGSDGLGDEEGLCRERLQADDERLKTAAAFQDVQQQARRLEAPVKMLCNCCGFGPVSCRQHTPGPGEIAGVGDLWFCALCRATHASHARVFAHLESERHVLAAVCYVGNVILARIERAEGAPLGDRATPEPETLRLPTSGLFSTGEVPTQKLYIKHTPQEGESGEAP